MAKKPTADTRPTPEQDLFAPDALAGISRMTLLGVTGGRPPIGYPSMADDQAIDGYVSALVLTVTPRVAVVITLSSYDTYTVERVRTPVTRSNHLQCPVTFRQEHVHVEELDEAVWTASCWE